MEIQGKIIEILEARSGVSQRSGSNWMLQSYVLETLEQYPRRVCFEVFGEDKIKSFAIQKGELLTVSFDIDAREYQGRWYNSVRAWKVDRNQAAAAPQQPAPAPFPPQQPAPSQPIDNGGDQLPF